MIITMYCENCNAVCFERFSVVLGHFPKASCAKHLLLTKSIFLRKWASILVFGIFNFSETNRIKDNRISIRYISINFDRKFNKKSHSSLSEQTQRTRNILKSLHVYINSSFKLLVILPFVVANNLKGELLF